MGYLEELRREIDDVDKKLVELFQKRMEIVSNVAKYKIENDLPVLNSLREEEVINKNINYLENKELQNYLREFYIHLMNLSKDYQKQKIDEEKEEVNVCFQGTEGSYSEDALFEYFGERVNTYPVKEFEDVFKEFKSGKIDYGVLPIENSSTGAITEVYDLLKKHGLYIVGNVSLKINHNLMAVKGTKLEDIKTIYSHPQAFGQCSEFLKKGNWNLIPYHNTALSAELIRDKNSNDMAAIGSKKAANINGLEIVKTNINNNDSNYTRFIVIGKNLETDEKNNAISIVFSSPNKVGALYDSLGIFKENNLNMIRIESRPIVGKPWEYFFYVDFEGDINNERVKDAISYIENNSSYFKLLGNYRNQGER